MVNVNINTNSKNEKLKRRYFEYLREGKGYSESSIIAYSNAIKDFEQYINYDDFANFNKYWAINYKKYMLESKTKKNSQEKISQRTVFNYLGYLKAFFTWMSSQPGYKKKIDYTIVEYFNLSKAQVNSIKEKRRNHIPSVDEVIRVINSIDYDSNEINMRNRAMLSCSVLGGIRIDALRTLPIKSFNPETLEVYQLQELGVCTKFSKDIYSTLIKFDEKLIKYILDWREYLLNQKGFKDSDPLFPKGEIVNDGLNKSFVCNSVKPEFWKNESSIRNIFKKCFKNAGIDYYPPHSFRYVTIQMALSKCKNAREMKAISQNFGHNNIATTFNIYGTLKREEVHDIISNMNFEKNIQDNIDKEIIIQLEEVLNKCKKKM